MGWVNFGEIEIRNQSTSLQGCVIFKLSTEELSFQQSGGNGFPCGPPSVIPVSANVVVDATTENPRQSL